jgi:HD-like signal output (HDOD) protein
VDIQQRILQSIHDLPTLPTVYSALSEALANPRCGIADVAAIISNDQASTFKVLKIVNSAFYGFSGRIDTISRAITILGFDEVRNLVLTSSIMDLFSKTDPLLHFRPADFWAHSIATGTLTRHLGQTAGIRHIEHFLVAGILHDIGKLFFFESAGQEYARVLTLVNRTKKLIREAELEVLGMDHAEGGRLVAGHWNLPEPLCNAIRWHHDGLEESNPDPLVACVHIADFLARAFDLGYSGDNAVPLPSERAWEVLNLAPGTVKHLLPDFFKDYDEMIALLLHG